MENKQINAYVSRLLFQLVGSVDCRRWSQENMQLSHVHLMLKSPLNLGIVI